MRKSRGNVPGDAPELLDEVRAAEYLGLTTSMLAKRRSRKMSPEFFRLGRFVRYSRTALDDFLEASRVKPEPPK